MLKLITSFVASIAIGSYAINAQYVSVAHADAPSTVDNLYANAPLKRMQYVEIEWSDNGKANAHPKAGNLTVLECARLASAADSAVIVPACIPDDVDF